MKLQDYIYTSLEREIMTLYQFFGIVSPSQIDMSQIAQKLNIWLSFIDFEKKSLQAVHSDLYIFLNKNDTSDKQWFGFAKELSHFIHHHKKQLSLPSSAVTLSHTKSKQLAMHFCIPTFMLTKLNLPNHKNKAIHHIADTFNVPISLAKERYEEFEKEIAGSQFFKALNQKVQADPEKERLKAVCKKYNLPLKINHYEQLTTEQKERFVKNLKSWFGLKNKSEGD
ncbi:ImmA/IrrE family metallo-endopeptidase [Bacillus tianshenii]|nr:ImmA/IrrE family metallo-endopeptidase [Bacillus tianshenii]